jgi:signal peptidase I
MRERPELKHKKDGGISLSGNAVLALLSAVHEKGAGFRFRAPGISMYPTIRDGDIITLSPLNGIKPVTGDIVGFRHPDTGKLIVHRIIKISSDSFLAKGDNSRDTDGVTPILNILGVVTSVERNGTHLFWPDIRRSPRAARIFFWIQYDIWRIKMKIYTIYKEVRSF